MNYSLLVAAVVLGPGPFVGRSERNPDSGRYRGGPSPVSSPQKHQAQEATGRGADRRLEKGCVVFGVVCVVCV